MVNVTAITAVPVSLLWSYQYVFLCVQCVSVVCCVVALCVWPFCVCWCVVTLCPVLCVFVCVCFVCVVKVCQRCVRVFACVDSKRLRV